MPVCLLAAFLGLISAFQDSPTPGHSGSAKYWIFFTDKDSISESRLTNVRSLLPRTTLERRLKHGTKDRPVVDEYDLPVSPRYLRALDSLGVRIILSSRWLNAVSVILTPDQANQAKAWPFVRKVRPLARGYASTVRRHVSMDEFSYGLSLNQVRKINIVGAHQLGYTGTGVIIGMLDSGFLLDHIAFQSLQVIGRHDFVDGDDDVGEEIPSHGTAVLSMIAGLDNGRFVGAAPHASFLLARTLEGSGTKAEEDQWIAGLEWLEYEGAQIVCSTITFFDDFFGPDSVFNYELEDLDGRTAAATLATDVAFDKGVLVINSAGNYGERGSGYLGTPSDGRKMIAVGAMTGDSTVAYFSSTGPTADGRVKPDVVAPGFNVISVSTFSTTGYQTSQSGTSFSAPLTAGVAALAREAHPDWTVQQLYDAIRRTSSQATHPDNLLGYGVPDALKLIHYAPPSSKIQISDLTWGPNPFDYSTRIEFKARVSGRCSVHIYNVLGQLVAKPLPVSWVSVNDIVSATWNGRSLTGRSVSDGVYFCRITLEGHSKTIKLVRTD